MPYILAISIISIGLGAAASLLNARTEQQFRADPQPTRAADIAWWNAVSTIATWLVIGGTLGTSWGLDDAAPALLKGRAPDWLLTAGIWLLPLGVGLTVLASANHLAKLIFATPPACPVAPRKNFGAWTPWFGAYTTRNVFKVFITDDMLCGARVRGGYIDDEAIPAAAEEPGYWLNTVEATLYERLDVTSTEFLVLNERNFHIRWRDVAEAAYEPKKRWRHPNVPHSGRLILKLRNGNDYDFLLLGLFDDGKLIRQIRDAVAR